MKYKPDRFEKNAIRIIGVISAVVFGALFIVLLLVRLSDDPATMFSDSNIAKAGLFLAVAIYIGIFVSRPDQGDDED